MELTLRERVKKIQAKGVPRLSKSGDASAKLNGKVDVSPDLQSASTVLEPVECRHFATVFAQAPGKKSALISRLASISGVRRLFNRKLTAIDGTYEKSIREAPQDCKHLVPGDQLGRYLSALALALQEAPEGPDQPRHANCLLLTADHTMVLHVERKYKDGVHYFAAKLYDPNDTACYKRVVQLEPEGLSGLALKDLLIRPNAIHDEYGAPAGGDLSMVAVSLDHRVQPSMDRGVPLPSAAHTHIALASGSVDAFQALLTSAQTLGLKRSTFDLLNAKSHKFTPGLNIAFQEGYVDAVRDYAQTVLRSQDLTPAQKVELLAARRADGSPGLLFGLELGHAEAVKAFIDTVLSSDELDAKQKVELLAAKRADGLPGLYIALQNGHTETVRVFAQAVLNSKHLSSVEKAELLGARRADGMPGLISAFFLGHTDTVKALAELVLPSDALDSAQKVDLLAAKTPHGVSGL